MSSGVREVVTLTVGAAEDGVRLDRWFKRRWPHLNHIQINKLVRSGQVRVDGGRAKVDTRLAAGVQVRVPPLPDAPVDGEGHAGLSQRDIAFARSLVLYEDDEVLALNKPSGLAVQGGTKTTKHVDRLLSAWGEGMDRPRLVHRLDRDTSGVLLLGKTPAAAAMLAGAFAKRRAKKIYWALVAGEPKPHEGVIELHLIKKGVGDREMVVPADPKEPGAEAAETEYVTVARAAHRAAWMALQPYTGRTHQLRAHMKAIGHPILGDPKYCDEASASLSAGLKLQLHARRLELPHPSRGQLVIEAPLSPEMKEGFARFGFDEHEASNDPFAGGGRRRPSSRRPPSAKALPAPEPGRSARAERPPRVAKPPRSRPSATVASKPRASAPRASKPHASGPRASGSHASGPRTPKPRTPRGTGR